MLTGTPSGRLEIERHDVHVWSAGLHHEAPVLDALRATLDDDELARAERFVFERHRLRYIAAHGLLRRVLSGYLGVAPTEIRFGHARHGKPYLVGEVQLDLRFNLSHSGDRMLVAVAVGRDVGVDLELVGRDRDFAGIARHFFSPNEVAALTALPERERRAAFYRCWTRKEAYIKACGTGLAMRLDDFDVALAPGVPAALLRSARGAGEPARWRFADLQAGRAFEAALAVEGGGWRLVTYALEVAK
jgi:4'-phosphopantetheinyl transferase